ncbi:hypothetical protein CI105_03040 [Candidatus Izimaplasma bacterium ZiA1]|uniref:HU family DNA-binding protein n=1 Tax=Candidatus Izimoplasma sp. ZiA1 TaxID=2024899 RepID=UPI000BAA3B62|nr:hypothetical protein CI105_03040 [Candidatus Izimaplasma bacterium ZiA1]
MRSSSNLFRRLSIIFLILSLVTLFVIAALLILSITDDAIVCPEDSFICHYEEEFRFYQNTIVGLGLIMALLIIMSRFFQLQIKYVAEYSGYTKSVSEEEQKIIEESTKASSALKEYFQLLEDKKNNSHQMSIDDYDETEDADLTEDSLEEMITDKDLIDISLETEKHSKNKINYPSDFADEDENNRKIIDEEKELESLTESAPNNITIEPLTTKSDDIKDLNESKEDISTEKIDNKSPDLLIRDAHIQKSSAESESKKVKEYYVRKTKSDFYGIIYKETDLNKTKSKLFLNTLLNVITEEISQGNIININEFGKFRKVSYKEQLRINPKTGKKISVKAHSLARFYPHKNLKEIVDKGELDFTKKYLKSIKIIEPKITTENMKKVVSKKSQIKTLTKSIHKTEIISIISAKSLLSKNKSQQFLNAFISVLTNELKSGNSINIPEFGKFKTVKRAPKEAVNPQTLERIKINAHNSVKLLFDKNFKEKIK